LSQGSVNHDLRRLDRRVASRIIDKIEEELASADFRPVPLSGAFKDCSSFGSATIA